MSFAKREWLSTQGNVSMSFIDENDQLKELKRGIVDFISEKDLLAKLKKSKETNTPLTIKAGFDPTRPDLHLGHTVLINKMRQFQNLGHRVVFLIGDFTAMIGDPTGTNETRPALSKEEVTENAKTYAEQVFKILDREKTVVEYNTRWFDQFKPDDFIRLTSKYTVARMLERDDFEKRYREHKAIGLHEFLYPLIQGYDSVALKSDVELGGTDQLFNILMGRDLQKAHSMSQQVVMTVPLLEGLDGVQKMSKSYDNYIGLEDSPKDMFGKTMRVSDELMFKYYNLLTDIPTAEIEQMQADVEQGKKHPRDVKVSLGKFLVGRFHSEEAADNAYAEFNRIFVNKGVPDDMPLFERSPEEIAICPFLTSLKMTQSNGEARRLIQGGAVTVADEKISDHQYKLNLKAGDSFIVKVGKKKFAQVKVI